MMEMKGRAWIWTGLVLILFFEVIKTEHDREHTYTVVVNGKTVTCFLCRPGFKWLGDCQTDNTTAKCTPCEHGSYDGSYNKATSCTSCTTVCPQRRELITLCDNGIRDNECRCKAGTHNASDVACVNHTMCAPGYQVKVNGTPYTDTVCEPCPKGNFSSEEDMKPCQPCTQCGGDEEIVDACTNSTDTKCRKQTVQSSGISEGAVAGIVIGVVVPVVIIIVIIIFCLLKKRRSRQQRQKETGSDGLRETVSFMGCCDESSPAENENVPVNSLEEDPQNRHPHQHANGYQPAQSEDPQEYAQLPSSDAGKDEVKNIKQDNNLREDNSTKDTQENPSQTCSDRMITDLCKDLVGNSWPLFFNFLIPEDGRATGWVSECKQNHPNDVREQIHGVLMKWKQSLGPEATCDKIIRALQEHERQDLVHKYQNYKL